MDGQIDGGWMDGYMDDKQMTGKWKRETILQCVFQNYKGNTKKRQK